jgi:sterol desaturase/sphingolipid hydroxylase (fatty acid hydroxylase superfamily)
LSGLLAHETAIRFGIFAAVLAALALAEAISPARKRQFPREARWPANLLLTIIDTAMLRLLFPLLAVGVAAWAEVRGIGLFNLVALPIWAAFAASLLLLDATIYAQHWAMHRSPILWRLHRVHHTDRDVDVTTSLRFHPGEIALSMGLKMAVVVALGAPPDTVIGFEIVLNAMAMFNHANWKLPAGVERTLRALIVTPDMHRIHHSLKRSETDSNYGFNLSLWDRLFGTYCGHASQTGFALGLESFQSPAPNGIFFVIMLPFRRGPSR